MDPISVGIVGCGYWGPNLIRNFARSRQADVRWICDRIAERTEKVSADLNLTARLTQNPREILGDPETQAVVIATPVSTHYRLVREALTASKHVLVEKPLAQSTEEAAGLIEMAEKNGRVLMVDHTFQFAAPVVKLRELLQGETLGNLLYVNAVRVNLGLFQEDISVLWDLAPHDLSILDYLLKRTPEEVSANGMAHIDKRFADVAFVTLHYADGLMGHLHVSWLDPCKSRRMTLVGDRRMAVYDDMDPNEPIRIFDKGVTKQPYFDDFGEFKLHYRLGDIHSPRIQITEPLKGVCRHFLECIRENRSPLRGDARSGMRIVRILEAAERSMNNRGQRMALTG